LCRAPTVAQKQPLLTPTVVEFVAAHAQSSTFSPPVFDAHDTAPPTEAAQPPPMRRSISNNGIQSAFIFLSFFPSEILKFISLCIPRSMHHDLT
jgi:hypothetical protein